MLNPAARAFMLNRSSSMSLDGLNPIARTFEHGAAFAILLVSVFAILLLVASMPTTE